jgi:hypothetical protein
MKTERVVMWATLALLGFAAYKFFKKGADVIAKPIADLYVALSSPSAPKPRGVVIMPDGSTFPAARLSNMGFGFQGKVALFTAPNGSKYFLSPHDAEGNYVATLF